MTAKRMDLVEVRLTEFISWLEISKSTAYELLNALGIEPVKLRVPGVNAPVSFLTPGQKVRFRRLLVSTRAA